METKSSLSRRLISQNDTIDLKNVVQVIIENYDESNKIDVEISNIITEVPPATKVGGITVPSLPFKITNEGWLIDSVKIKIVFPTGSGKVIINSTTVKCTK